MDRINELINKWDFDIFSVKNIIDKGSIFL